MTRPEPILGGASVVVLEDDYYLATDLQNALLAAGAEVIGPFSGEADARLGLGGRKPDCAVVDINLGCGPSFELSRELLGREVPLTFVTGYDVGAIPDDLHLVGRLQKPVDMDQAVLAVARLLGRESTTR